MLPILAGLAHREILESIVNPSRVISDQYKSKKILTAGGDQFIGMVVRDGPNSFIILDSEGRTTRIVADEIDEIAETTTSAMPKGLLDKLTMDEIADLFQFLSDPQSVNRSADAETETEEKIR